MLNSIKKYWLVLLIIAFGMMLRLYQSKVGFMYGHDQDLGSWFVKDIVFNKHLRLIGQETSTQGVFIGPLFYYLLIPFYIINSLNPIGGVWLVSFIALFSFVSLYFVFNKIFDRTVALIALSIYSVSPYIISNDREVVPTMPVILWTVWYLYALHQIIKGDHRKGFILTGILIPLIWHLNFALILLTPLVAVAYYLSGKKVNIKDFTGGLFSFLIVNSPFVLFEVRHNFSQTKAVYLSLLTNQYDIISGADKFWRVIHLLAKDLHGLLIGSYPNIKYEWVLYFLVCSFVFVIVKKVISKDWATIFVLWLLSYIIFFSSYSKIMSEYYLNGLIIIFISIISLLISFLIKNKQLMHFGIVLIGLIITFSYRKYISTPLNKSGYTFRKEIVEDIKKDSLSKGYNCVSISFITDPGYDLGYRYLIYLSTLKIRPISAQTPVYTIVYPLKNIFPVNKTYGVIGLIYPDYARYGSIANINRSCEGDNINVTQPLWGFVAK